jgi:hypothetical protein
MDTAAEGPKRTVVSNWKTKAANIMERRSLVGSVKAGTNQAVAAI